MQGQLILAWMSKGKRRIFKIAYEKEDTTLWPTELGNKVINLRFSTQHDHFANPSNAAYNSCCCTWTTKLCHWPLVDWVDCVANKQTFHQNGGFCERLKLALILPYRRRRRLCYGPDWSNSASIATRWWGLSASLWCRGQLPVVVLSEWSLFRSSSLQSIGI